MDTTILFQPHPLFRNPHFQTLASVIWPYKLKDSYPRHKYYIPTTNGDTLVAYSELQKKNPENCPDLLIIPGFEGNAHSCYVTRLKNKALQSGYNVHRMCLRGCGLSFLTTRVAYHPGLWEDVYAVMEHVRVGKPLFIVGISMGGNILLKMAGDLADKMPGYVKGIAALSAPLDLDRTERAFNTKSIYYHHFRRLLAKYYHLRCHQWPKIYKGLLPVSWRAMREFDHHVTGPLHGFSNVEEFYQRCSSGHGLHKIAVPSLLIHAQDDPIVPYFQYEDCKGIFEKNSNIHTVLPKYGGHIGFVHRHQGIANFWAEQYILSWFASIANGARQR